MKKLFALVAAVLFAFGLQAQQKSDLPNVTIKDFRRITLNQE